MSRFKNYIFFLILCVSGVCFLSLDNVQEEVRSRLGFPVSEGDAGPGGKTAPETGDASGGGTALPGGNPALSGGDPVLPGGDPALPGGDPAVSGGGLSGGETVSGNGLPAPAWSYVTVEDGYFDDAVFIGDSRTVGLNEYGGLTNSTFYSSTGLTVYKLFTAEIVPVPGSKKKTTVEEALKERRFAKIYLMVGINEMGTGTVESFIAKYREQLDRLRELQPDALIYLQAIMRVSSNRSEKGDYINNAGIDARNAEIAKLADNEKIFYLDVNPLICDENGGMTESYTFDGVHLKAEYVLVWKQFLKEHAVKFEGRP